MEIQKIAIICNGDVNDYEWLASELVTYDTVIAANGGSAHLRTMDMHPHVLIGDQDSLEHAVNESTEVFSFPEDKDASDMELAIQHARTLSPSVIDIFGGMGGRHDHQFCNIMVLTNYRELITIRTWNSNTSCVHEGSVAKLVKKGNTVNTVTIMPVDSTAALTSSGLLYQLDNQWLERGSRGLSNIMTAEKAIIEVHSGIIILFHSW